MKIISAYTCYLFMNKFIHLLMLIIDTRELVFTGKTVYARYVGSALQLGFIIDDIILQTHSLNFTSF